MFGDDDDNTDGYNGKDNTNVNSHNDENVMGNHRNS